ncbi:hypothetical protein MAR_031610 [Mya arenaria]|uniref:Uncharacterized protein n=1 Tax=Mya arenaria TaxID=6604 RepID=A0ABY7F894_MYAAR|nr:uncharacterized protein LOC128205117 [Mya arenaria]WAR17016.1 hypothetical protein MAR_031610 [Mya arenaria]
MYVAVLLVCVGYLVRGSDGATFFSPTIVRTINGEKTTYCEYDGIEYTPPGNFTDNKACVKCTCNEKGLSCHSISFKYHYDETTAQCQVVTIKCKNFWRMKNDLTKECPKNMLPKVLSMSGK